MTRLIPIRNLLKTCQDTWLREVRSRLGLSADQRYVNRFRSYRPIRIAVVKQDVQDDLYCCNPGSDASTIVLSTLMRTGPAALFTEFDTDFVLLKTVPDEECQVWREKANELGWYTIDQMIALQTQIPNRSFGHSAFAHDPAEIEWEKYDLVISIDVSIPDRITRQFPNTTWCYFVREPKTSSYAKSLLEPAKGQNLFLNQTFALRRQRHAPHVIDFPYYLQKYGCFHQILNTHCESDEQRSGLFFEHHSPSLLTERQLTELERGFGPVDSTCREVPRHGPFIPPMQKCQRTCRDILTSLTSSRYFVTLCSSRFTWGNALVEAVAAGALVVGDPSSTTHRDLFSARTIAVGYDQLYARLRYFEANPAIRQEELNYQRRIVDYLCFWRPMADLLRSHSRRLLRLQIR